MISFRNIKIEKCPECGSVNLTMRDSTITRKSFSVKIECMDCSHTEELKG